MLGCSCSNTTEMKQIKNLTINGELSRSLSNVVFNITNETLKDYEFLVVGNEPGIHIEVRFGGAVRRFVSNKAWNETFMRLKNKKMSRPASYKLLESGKSYKGKIDLSEYKEFTKEGEAFLRAMKKGGTQPIVLKLPYRETVGGSDYGELKLIFKIGVGNKTTGKLRDTLTIPPKKD